MDRRTAFISPTGIPYWSTGKRHQRAFVKRYHDGGFGEGYEEADHVKGLWTECQMLTVDEIRAIYPTPKRTRTR